MMKHKGPYKITFVSDRGRTYEFTRKTFKAAENVAGYMFDRSRMLSIQITNANGLVHSAFNKKGE